MRFAMSLIALVIFMPSMSFAQLATEPLQVQVVPYTVTKMYAVSVLSAASDLLLLDSQARGMRQRISISFGRNRGLRQYITSGETPYRKEREDATHSIRHTRSCIRCQFRFGTRPSVFREPS